MIIRLLIVFLFVLCYGDRKSLIIGWFFSKVSYLGEMRYFIFVYLVKFDDCV